MKLITVNLQSFSDIITNSSSELFCVIDGDIERLKSAEAAIGGWFREYDCECEITENDDNIMQLRCYLSINLEDWDIYHYAVKTKLDKLFGENNYEINFFD